MSLDRERERERDGICLEALRGHWTSALNTSVGCKLGVTVRHRGTHKRKNGYGLQPALGFVGMVDERELAVASLYRLQIGLRCPALVALVNSQLNFHLRTSRDGHHPEHLSKSVSRPENLTHSAKK